MTSPDYHFLLKDLWPYEVVFCRWLMASLLLPGFSINVVNSQVRILFSLSLCVCVTPFLVAQNLIPQNILSISFLLQECLIGLFLGTISRLIIQMLEVAGAIISHQSALTNVFVSNAAEEEQSSLPGVFLSLCLVTLIFVNDLHHLLLQGILDSYHYFPPGGALFIDDMSQTVLQTIIQGFTVAVQISSPFIVLGILFYITMGLLNRLMPQLQIFFISQPFEIFLSLLIFISALPNILAVFFKFMTGIFAQWVGR